MYRYRFFTIDQPVGRFYVASINASIIIPLSQSDERTPYNDTGIQRKLNINRVNDIAKYCETDSAMFPTPIILSGKSEFFSFFREKEDDKQIEYENLNNGYIEINEDLIKDNHKFFSIVDGQHRLAGIEKSGKASDFDLLIMFIFDTEAFQDAEIFSVINRNQKQVSASLVYDLYGLSNSMTVEKFAHEIVSALNNINESKLKNRIKMLGYKTDYFNDKGEVIKQYVSQAALAYEIILLISSNSTNDNLLIRRGDFIDYNIDDNKVLRKYFALDQLYLAQMHTMAFFNEWISKIEERKYEKSIMFKTVGFIAAFKVFQRINQMLNADFIEYNNRINENRNLNDDEVSVNFECLSELEKTYKKEIDKLSFDNIDVRTISSSRSGAKKITDILFGELY